MFKNTETNIRSFGDDVKSISIRGLGNVFEIQTNRFVYTLQRTFLIAMDFFKN